MSMLDMLSQRDSWERFYIYKSSLVGNTEFCKRLRKFIDNEGYISICKKIECGEKFPLAGKSVISKLDSQKKRVVYTYPEAENMVLKLLTHLILRKYDYLFSNGLYSFRPNRTAKDAVRRITRAPDLNKMYSYKADISNYFNSVPIDKFLPMLQESLYDDKRLYFFLSSLLAESHVIEDNKIISEEKGIMAGTPLSAFYANLYLKELDSYFAEKNVLYERYSDDIILFADSMQKCEKYAEFLRHFITEYGLKINPEKESFNTPEEGWTFLGFSYKDGVIDIAPVSIMKMKHKMRRKTRALQRWKKRNEVDGEKAALAFIRIFNKKLFEGSENNDLTWNKWFFPVINTDKSLRVIDSYAQDCIRFLLTDKRTKSRYNARYEDIRRLGLKNLVHEYYSYS